MIPYRAIITGETNDSRFETFCRTLLQQSENITLVSTSTTYDLGRDAVSIRPTQGTHAEIVCCTLNKDLETKVLSDGKRLATTKTVPGHVYYCCSVELSEHRINQLTADLRSQLPSGCSVSMMGAKQLSDLAERFPSIFREFYHAEVRSAEATLQAFQVGQQTRETRGLRLALLAFESDDARELRRQITTRAILDVLRVKRSCNSSVLAGTLAEDLGLPSPVSTSFIDSILQQTVLRGLASKDASGCWILTAAGEVEAASVPPEAAQEILSGKTIVRNELQRLIGKKISDSQYDLIWSSFLDFLSEYFYTNGLAVISTVNTFLLGAQPVSSAQKSLESLIEQGAKKARTNVATAELGDELEQAIKDVFTERSGPAFEWLSRLCERFVALCALGLEGTSSEEVRTVLIKHRLVLDTDIILTLLCESESDHHAAKELITRFRQVGGKVVLSTHVLEEVAYHAWISEREFKENIPLFGKLSPDDLPRYIRNTFVQAFFLLGWKKEAKVEQWNIYISAFRGTSSHDYSKLLRALQRDLSAERLPELIDESLRKDVTEFMKESAARSRRVNIDDLAQDEIGKADTDGKLMGSIGAARENLRQQGAAESLVLVTSSGRLRRADQQYRNRLGAPNAVMFPAALSYLLSLIPGVNLGISTLRRALFEFRDSGRLADTQRLALRVLKSSDVYEIPWAARGTLEEHLNEVLRKEADKYGQKVEVIKDRFKAGDESLQPAQLILEAVKSMAATDKRDEQIRAAERRISELEEQVKLMARIPAQKKK